MENLMISDTFKQNKEQQQAFQSLEFPKPDNVDGGMVSRIRKRRLKPSLLDTSKFKPTKRKRAKIELDSVSDCDRLRDEAGRLKTTDSDDRTKVLIIKVGEEPWRIGRSLEADLTIRSPTVSSWHCKLYAIECDTGERLVCLEDTSTNGVKLNDKIIHNRAVILNNHDRLKISDQEFVYLHTWPAGQWQGLNGSSINPSSSLLNISRFNPILIGNYKITERVLGSGFFSVVHLAIHRFDQSQVACKILRKTKRSSLPISSKASMAKGSDRRVFELERLRFKNLVEKEVKLNASLDHPNINKIIDLEQDPERIYLFLELVTGGDLFGYIVRKKKLSSDESKFILFQLVLGLQYMHDIKGISHRDIKPENILLTNHGPEPRVLISDFGAARLSDRAFLSMQGTMSYSAPEVLTVYTNPRGYDGKKADVWALGICLYMMLCGFHPFDRVKLESTSLLINENETEQEQESEKIKIGKRLRLRVESDEVCLIKNVLRPSCKEDAMVQINSNERRINDKENLNQIESLLNQMLEVEARDRIEVSRILLEDWIKVDLKFLRSKYQRKVLLKKPVV